MEIVFLIILKPVGDDNSNANPYFGTTQTPGQQNDKSNFNNFLTTINRWLSDKDS
jgi:hypothetical protein